MLLRIRELRQAAGLTQEYIANKVGTSVPTVCLWESGKNQPTVDKLPKIAGILGVTIGELFAAGDNTIVPENEV